jgi:hypothetical protein
MTEIRRVTLEQASEEFGARANSQKVVTALREATGLSLDELPKGPILSCSPYLAYPGAGVLRVVEIAIEAGLEPVIYTYEADSYTSVNPEKADCIKPPLEFNSARRTRPKIANTPNGRTAVGEIPTIYIDEHTGQSVSLAEYYRRASGLILPKGVIVEDLYELYLNLTRQKDPNANRPSARDYYLGSMALSQVFGVGINAGGNEDSKFYETVVRPAILQASQILGVEPIAIETQGLGIPTGRDARVIDVGMVGCASIQDWNKKLKISERNA